MSIVFLGIGGSGMRGLAYLLEQSDETIIGYDDNPEYTMCSLHEAATALKTADRLIYTDAAVQDHPLREAARTLGVCEVAYQTALGEFSQEYITIAVTGTHGKSSTTAFLAHILIENKLDPTVLLGANMPTLPGGHARLSGKQARIGKSKFFIVEADEYRRHFLELSPAHCIITSIDFDHPDAFSSLEDTEHAYSEFISRIQAGGQVIAPLAEIKNHPNIAWLPDTISVSDNDAQKIAVPIPGRHMQMNAALACEAAYLLGIAPQHARKALATFPGLSRRFELLGTYNGTEIRSDYGHHPTEISATLAGARQMHPHARITAIFEAHMPLRLQTFFSAFITALASADVVLIVPPFVPAGRDSGGAILDAQRLAQEITKKGTPATYIPDISEFPDALDGDIAIGFSAGTLDSYLRKIVKKS